MTKKERMERARNKKRLQADGVLPPDKQKLNRKKFINEARDEWNGRDSDCFIWDFYLTEAIGIMMANTERYTSRTSAEAIGAAKCLKLAVRLRAFYGMVRARGDDHYKIKELYDYIRDIIEA